MPYSSPAGKNYILKVLDKIIRSEDASKAYRVLDVGAGSGTYSMLYRSYLPGHWTAYEVWAPYVDRFDLRAKYDWIVVGNIRFADPGSFDIAFFGDVIEHMTKEDAVTVVQRLLLSSRYIIISIPIWYYPQEESEGNPYEAHVKPDWSDEEVKDTFGSSIIASDVEGDIGVYVLSVTSNTCCDLS